MRFTASVACILKRVGKLTKEYSNLPDAYIKRAAEQVEYTAPKMIQYLPYQRKKKARHFRFGAYRPWTQEFQQENERIRDEIFVEPIKNWSVFRGDRVEIHVGRDKGKQGIVAQIFEERNWVIVGGMNWYYRRVGETKGFAGTIIRQEIPLLVTTEVSLVDPSDDKPTTVVWRYTEDGEKVRVSKRTGRIIPIPALAHETYDYKVKSAYLESDKDTKSDVVEKVTFQPELKTFEMDIMDAMGIEEKRTPKKSYWY